MTIYHWCRGFVGVVAAVIGLGSPPAARAEGAAVASGPVRAEGIHWPGEGGRKIRVSVGLYVIDFARISIREESFNMAGYLDTSWTDPSLAPGPGEHVPAVRRFRPGQVWAPALEFVNAVEQVVTEREGDLYAEPDGRVTQRVRFSHNFRSPLQLRRFPFDSQVLKVVIAPFDPFAKDIDLVVDGRGTGALPGASVPDWTIGEVKARVEPPNLEPPSEQAFVFEARVERRSTYYVWRVLLPMTLLVIGSWSVFWFDPTGLQPQVSTGLAILLSLVTFTYAIDFSLPKVAYLTFIDRYTLNAFAFVLAVLLSVTVIHGLIRRERVDLALRAQARLRQLFPAAYVLSLAVTALLGLG